MKGTRLAGVALLALAMMLVVIPVSGASAAKHLLLSHEKVAAANGSAGDEGLQLGECGLFSIGTIVENDASKVKFAETSTEAAECPAGETISGKFNEAELKSSGKSALKGTIILTKESPLCVYNFTKFKSFFTVGTEAEPGFLFMKGETTGKLNKEASNKEKGVCEKKITRTWFSTGTYEVFGEPYETTLGP
jgi:hypothetical protein